jgi:hypothetical protein
MTSTSETAPASTIAALEARLERIEDRARIANLMGHYSYCNFLHRFRELAGHFALSERDVSIDIDNMARWVGGQKVRAYLLTQDLEPVPNPELPLDLSPSPAQMHEHTLTTPIIEVAGDGRTAQGLWISPGHETVNGTAYWAWCKYAVDFKKLAGVWKIWHLKVHGTFFTPYHRDWVETAQTAPTDTVWSRDAGSQATSPWQYNGRDMAPPPRIPRPYPTWDDSMSN